LEDVNGQLVIPRGLPLLQEPAFEVGPPGDVRTILTQINNMQFYFQSRTPDEFREISSLHFQKIYGDLDQITGQIKGIVGHEQFLHERWQQIAPFTLRLRADTEKFAQDVCGVLQQHENKFAMVSTELNRLGEMIRGAVASIPPPARDTSELERTVTAIGMGRTGHLARVTPPVRKN
jgi:hypothetical protein